MFQYKIIHNILATKMSLFRAKMSDNDVRPQCLADTHSLDHMFLRCSSVIAFWKTFQNCWTNKTKQQLALSNSIILYVVFDKTEHRYSLNYALLLAKFSIYCSCLQDEKLSFVKYFKSSIACEGRCISSSQLSLPKMSMFAG